MLTFIVNVIIAHWVYPGKPKGFRQFGSLLQSIESSIRAKEAVFCVSSIVPDGIESVDPAGLGGQRIMSVRESGFHLFAFTDRIGVLCAQQSGGPALCA